MKAMAGYKKDTIIAFICGDAVVMFGQIIGKFWDDAGHFGVKVLATIILGIAGGIAGMVGKDIYKWYKNRKNKPHGKVS